MNTRHLRPDDLRGKRWRGLVRESTAEQADKWSPERQKSDLIRAAEELGLEGDDQWYVRVGSGEAESVDELAEALADGKAGQYDVLLVVHTSRFARNRAEAVRMKAAFRKAGLVIYFVAQRLISGSLTGALTEGISEVIDENENEQRRWWIAGGIRERQLSGRWVGAVPFGYRRAMADFPDGSRRWDGRLEADPEAAPIVRRIFDEIGGGVAARTIAVALNAEGQRIAGRPWSRRTVARIATNPAYAGRLVRYRQDRPGRHYYPEADAHDGRQELADMIPALVEPLLWAQVQAIFTERLGGSSHREAYPLSRVLRCGECGRRMTGVNNGAQRYYRCPGRAEMGVCSALSVRAEIVEREFADWLNTFRLPKDWRTRIARLPDRDADADAKRRRALEERLARVRQLFAWGDMSEEDYRREALTIRGEMGLVVRPNIGNVATVAAALESLGRKWLGVTGPARAVLPGLMLHELVVRDRRVSEWVVRAELRPLFDLRVLDDPSLKSTGRRYSLRFSA